MRQLLMTVAGLCALAAVCEQVMGDSRYFRAIRLVLGLSLLAALLREGQRLLG